MSFGTGCESAFQGLGPAQALAERIWILHVSGVGYPVLVGSSFMGSWEAVCLGHSVAQSLVGEVESMSEEC